MKASALLRLLPLPVWRRLRAVDTAVLTPLRFSRRTGHWRSSLSSKALGPGGSAIPWYTYPAVDFLSQRDFARCRVLEFGGGQSTLWWADRALEVVCIEEDRAWHDAIKAAMPANVGLFHIPVDRFGEVAAALAAKGGQYDIIIVDGHRRREAAALARHYLSESGAMILDNAEGYGFYEETSEWNLRRVDFYGFAPVVRLRHCTSILFGPNCFLFDAKIPIQRID